MKNEYFENEWMVNHNHQKVKSQEFDISEYEYTDHEIRMQQLESKSKVGRIKVEREAVKYGLIGLIILPVFWKMMWLMINLMWAYSYAVRGF